MAKFLVTGGCGFIGSHLVQQLINDGHEVVVLDNLSTGFESYLPKSSNVTFLNVDISNWGALSKTFAYFKNALGVFHFAAVARIQPSIYAPHLTHDSNVTGTLNILEMMRMCDVKNIVYSASSSYYGLKQTEIPSKETDLPDCQTPYAISKYMGELYCETWAKLYNLNVVRLRYFNVWGPRSPADGPYAPVISRFYNQARLGQDMTVIGDGTQRRDFTYVDDVVRANILAMKQSSSSAGYSELFNIGTGTNYSILNIAQKIQKIIIGSRIVHVPPRIGEAKTSLADNTKAKEVLGWFPEVSFDEGLEKLHKWYWSFK